jgi:hypothetical protein
MSRWHLWCIQALSGCEGRACTGSTTDTAAAGPQRQDERTALLIHPRERERAGCPLRVRRAPGARSRSARRPPAAAPPLPPAPAAPAAAPRRSLGGCRPGRRRRRPAAPLPRAAPPAPLPWRRLRRRPSRCPLPAAFAAFAVAALAGGARARWLRYEGFAGAARDAAVRGGAARAPAPLGAAARQVGRVLSRRFHPQFRDKNRRHIGKCQSQWTASRINARLTW